MVLVLQIWSLVWILPQLCRHKVGSIIDLVPRAVSREAISTEADGLYNLIGFLLLFDLLSPRLRRHEDTATFSALLIMTVNERRY